MIATDLQCAHFKLHVAQQQQQSHDIVWFDEFVFDKRKTFNINTDAHWTNHRCLHCDKANDEHHFNCTLKGILIVQPNGKLESTTLESVE